MAKWWKQQKDAVTRAVHEAEERSGHQIVVHVDNLGRRPERTADQLAVKWSGASLLFCVDPWHRHFEIRWNDSAALDAMRATEAVTEPLRRHDLAAAVTALAALLPVQAPGEELPDVVDESE